METIWESSQCGHTLAYIHWTHLSLMSGWPTISQAPRGHAPPSRHTPTQGARLQQGPAQSLLLPEQSLGLPHIPRVQVELAWVPLAQDESG